MAINSLPLTHKDTSRKERLGNKVVSHSLAALTFFCKRRRPDINRHIRAPIAHDGRTCLHLAASEPNVRDRAGKIKFLIDNRARVDARDTDGLTPLHTSLRAGDLNTTKLFLLHGATRINQAKDGRTLLHDAAEINSKFVLQKLVLKAHPHLEVKDPEGLTPLHAAIKADSLGSASILSESGADKTTRDNERRTLLHTAAALGNREAISWLATFLNCRFSIDPSLDFRATDSAGKTPIDLAGEGGFDEAVTLMRTFEVLQYGT